MEELASLINPLDKATDKVALSTKGFETKVDDLKKRTEKEANDLKVNMNAKNKARMVPQSNDQSIERQRRTLVDKEISDMKEKLKQKSEEQEQIDAITNDISGLSSSLHDMEKERDQLSTMLASMNSEQGNI